VLEQVSREGEVGDEVEGVLDLAHPLTVARSVGADHLVLDELAAGAVHKFELGDAAEVEHVAEVEHLPPLRHEHVLQHRDDVLIDILDGGGELYVVLDLANAALALWLQVLRTDLALLSVAHHLDQVQLLENLVVVEAEARVHVLLDVRQGEAGVVVLEGGVAAHAGPDAR